MKKRIRLLLCVLVMCLGFVGCSEKKSEIEYEKATLKTTMEMLVSNFAMMEKEDIEAFEKMTEFEFNQTWYSMRQQYMQYGMDLCNVSKESFVAMANSWKAAEEECGAIDEEDYDALIDSLKFEFEEDSDEIVASANVEFKDRDATISFAFDENSNVKSLDVSAKFSMKEIMTKAGLNTLLGMGVVFAVLIFLAFIIGLFKYISVLLGQTKKQPKVAKEAPVAVKETHVVTPVTAKADDLELIAVISAAIAAMEGTSTDGFVVRSIRRRPSNNWN